LENKNDVCCFDAKPRFCIIDIIDWYSISKENILYLNCYSYFEQVLFANSIVEFDIAFDYRRNLQPAELFKRPFSVELIGAGFDKPANTRYFALRFLRVLKIYRDCLFRGAIGFEELQTIAKQYSKIPEDSKREETCWLERLFEGRRSRKRKIGPVQHGNSVTKRSRLE
jgi:DNA ligase 4